MEEREIWFRCLNCSKESYCGQEFVHLEDPDVLCPFCGRLMKLASCRLNLYTGAVGTRRQPAPHQREVI